MKTEEKLQICIETLCQLVTPSGAYSMDRLEHATNTIKETSRLAQETLDKIGFIIEKP